MNNEIILNNFSVANHLPLTLIAGPCQIENEKLAMKTSEFLVKMAEKLSINFIYKSSFDKANRTSAHASRGVGIEASINIFKKIKENFNCSIVTDVHNPEQCKIISPYVDILQIPAFLCRQTDLLEAAANTKKIVNVKKGQFLSPYDAKNIVEKFKHFGNPNLMLTERGTCFGYNNLVSDMRSLTIMAENNVPIIFDATHSVQQPGGAGNASGGERRFVETLSRAAVAIGIAAIYIETHPDPDNAPSDGPCMIVMDQLPKLMEKLMMYDKIAKNL